MVYQDLLKQKLFNKANPLGLMTGPNPLGLVLGPSQENTDSSFSLPGIA